MFLRIEVSPATHRRLKRLADLMTTRYGPPFGHAAYTPHLAAERLFELYILDEDNLGAFERAVLADIAAREVARTLPYGAAPATVAPRDVYLVLCETQYHRRYWRTTTDPKLFKSEPVVRSYGPARVGTADCPDDEAAAESLANQAGIDLTLTSSWPL